MAQSQGTAIDWAMGTGAAEALGRAASNRTLLDRIAAVFFLATFLFVGAYTWVRPDYNWDMVAYVATALENRTESPEQLHAETWKAIGEGARESQLYNLQYGNPYNRHQWENPADFESQLSMYRVKIGYIELLRVLGPVTGIVTAAILSSVLPLLGVGLICLLWLRQENALQGAIFLAPLLVVADLFHMTTAVTPDMLLAVVSMGAIYLLARKQDIAACLLLFLSVFVRPDNIILIFALLLTAIAFGWRILPIAVTFVASFAACMLIAKFGGHPGWWAHFYFSCVEIQNSMANFHPDFSLAAFVRGYARGVTVALIDNDWPPLFLAILAGWALLWRAGRTGTGRENALMFALAIGTLGKFASFPLPDDRFYFVFLAGMAMLLVVMWKPRFDIAPGKA
ncbi:hypothetical protein G6N74_06965 [Mesorhizobium sp. CGMCC 1.15528]|uniref:DUF2029 domain-containing protein n=1 Tax=Mesorhizobium zhangyense TaxID=1776730 RepID=A0A7C9R5P6_9HYPH|nr:hypothetical protein [Mesorhizobium zhangyense]NGN40801.1 hypothetical protein [Mesorhizobium zhangyense]